MILTDQQLDLLKQKKEFRLQLANFNFQLISATIFRKITGQLPLFKRESLPSFPPSLQQAPASAQKQPRAANVSESDKLTYEKAFIDYLFNKKYVTAAPQKRMRSYQLTTAQPAQEEPQYLSQQMSGLLRTSASQLHKKLLQCFKFRGQISTRRQQSRSSCGLYFQKRNLFELQKFKLMGREQGLVLKKEVLEFLLKDKFLLMLFRIDPYMLQQSLLQLQTQSPQALDFRQFNLFLRTLCHQSNLEVFADFDPSKISIGQRVEPVRTELCQGLWWSETVKEIYKQVQTYLQEKLSVKQLLTQLKAKALKRANLHKPFIKFIRLNKTITFAQFLYQLQHQSQFSQLSQEETEQLGVSFKFLIGQDRLKIWHKEVLQGKLEPMHTNFLQYQSLQIIYTTFQTAKSHYQFAKTSDFKALLQAHPLYSHISSLRLRHSSCYNLPVETLQQALDRILKESDQYIMFAQLLQFLSVGGRTQQLIQRNRGLIYQKADSESSDSDSPCRNVAQIKINRIKNRQKDLKKILSHSLKFTVPMKTRQKPRPQTIRQRRLRQQLKASEFVVIPFKANPVPSTNRGFSYQSIRAQQIKRKVQKKKRIRASFTSKQDDPVFRQPHCPIPQLTNRPFRARPFPRGCSEQRLPVIQRQNSERLQCIRDQIHQREIVERDEGQLGVRIQKRIDSLKVKWSNERYLRQASKRNHSDPSIKQVLVVASPRLPKPETRKRDSVQVKRSSSKRREHGDKGRTRCIIKEKQAPAVHLQTLKSKAILVYNTKRISQFQHKLKKKQLELQNKVNDPLLRARLRHSCPHPPLHDVALKVKAKRAHSALVQQSQRAKLEQLKQRGRSRPLLIEQIN